jgi:hypothetical protein
MKEKIHLERTEAGGQITWIPKGRIFVTIGEFEEKAEECDNLREMNQILVNSISDVNQSVADAVRWRNIAGIMHEYLREGDLESAMKHYEQECQKW